jgi:hypothetical protein
MPKLILSLALALVGALATLPSPAAAADGVVEPPQTYLRGNLGMYTIATTVALRIDRGAVNMPDAVGEENLSWDVQVLRADMRATARPAWRTARTATTLRQHVFGVSSGQIICVRARQHSWEVTSPWSRLTCVVRALDDEHLRRVGPVKVVKDVRYVDDHASRIRARTRVLIGAVPAGALYGPVFTDPGIRPDGTVCTKPSWRIRGQREPNGATGVTTGPLDLLLHRTSVAGTAIMRSPFGMTCPVGGFVVVPRWVPR